MKKLRQKILVVFDKKKIKKLRIFSNANNPTNNGFTYFILIFIFIFKIRYLIQKLTDIKGLVGLNYTFIKSYFKNLYINLKSNIRER